MNTFKKQKPNGTAHSSDGEAVNTNIPVAPSNPTTHNNDDKSEIEIVSSESTTIIDDKNRKVIDACKNSNLAAQQTIKLPQAMNDSAPFDPLVSTTNSNLQELETLLKSTSKNPTINGDKISASSQITSINDDIYYFKSMVMNLSQTLLHKMDTIEKKIDDHCNQTKKLNHTLTNTILPSLLDLTDIIQETAPSNLDSRVRTKLESIQTRIRTTQQDQEQQQTEMKDLMDI